MGEITLRSVNKNGTRISYDFFVTDDLKPFFSGNPFVIDYPVDIDTVPDAVAVIPFVCNVLPIIWLTDSALNVSELDQAFFECIPNVRAGYETMFPESVFAGKIKADRMVPNATTPSDKKLVFFSGGVDAVNTLVNHIDEYLILLSIWGSDIRYGNREGWRNVHQGIKELSEAFSLPSITIRSTFREFDAESALDKRFSSQLQDGWWHGIKHSLGLLGHAAPYAWLHSISTVYIASSNCPADGPVRCASNPLTDNYVRFGNSVVVHDGFEFSRQDKIRNIVEYVRSTKKTLSLHVCWESQSGSNCCHCEKCYRTMVALIAEGDDPTDYGFDSAHETMPDLRSYFVYSCKNMGVIPRQWPYIQNSLIKNQRKLENHPYWKDVNWITKVDFHDAKTIRMPFNLREWLSHFRFYQALHRGKTNCTIMKQLRREYKGLSNVTKRVFLIGPEEYGNLGDNQISESIIAFLKNTLPEHTIHEVPGKEWNTRKVFLEKIIQPHDLIVFTGGGNFGDQYPEPHNIRAEAIRLWPQNAKIVFPQTLYYTNSESGKSCLERDKTLYTKENHVYLFAREQVSYEIAKKHFSCNTYLIPDIVLTARLPKSDAIRRYILICLRRDVEKTLSMGATDALLNDLCSYGEDIQYTDLQLEYNVPRKMQKEKIAEKLTQWQGAKVLITDRLHGMIFAAITGTPCIVLSNYNHKVRGTYEWIRYLPYIRFAESVEDVAGLLPELLALEECRYDNTPLLPYFEKLAEVVREYASN